MFEGCIGGRKRQVIVCELAEVHAWADQVDFVGLGFAHLTGGQREVMDFKDIASKLLEILLVVSDGSRKEGLPVWGGGAESCGGKEGASRHMLSL